MTVSHWSQAPPPPRTPQLAREMSECDGDVNDRSRVLLVDPSPDNREVLRTALQRRGIGTFDTGQPALGLAWARQHRPDLIVLDTEWGNSAGEDICRQYAEAVHAPLLILGTLKSQPDSGADGAEHMAKPYHYAPLIRKIEEMIGDISRERVNRFHNG